MNNRKRDKNKRARLSLQNKDLLRNQLKLEERNKDNKDNEIEDTGEEDTLAMFRKEQRAKEKEEERQKYLLPIAEEDDPLNFFKNQEKEEKEEKEQDPLKFIKQEELEEGAPKVLGNLAKHDEKKLAEAIINNDIAEEIIVNKKEKNDSENKENKEQKMVRRMKTAMRFSQRIDFDGRSKDSLMKRMQEKKPVNPEITAKQTGNEQSGNTLLTADEQVDPANNPTQTTKTKDVDLKNFMAK